MLELQSSVGYARFKMQHVHKTAMVKHSILCNQAGLLTTIAGVRCAPPPCTGTHQPSVLSPQRMHSLLQHVLSLHMPVQHRSSWRESKRLCTIMTRFPDTVSHNQHPHPSRLRVSAAPARQIVSSWSCLPPPMMVQASPLAAVEVSAAATLGAAGACQLCCCFTLLIFCLQLL